MKVPMKAQFLEVKMSWGLVSAARSPQRRAKASTSGNLLSMRIVSKDRRAFVGRSVADSMPLGQVGRVKRLRMGSDGGERIAKFTSGELARPSRKNEIDIESPSSSSEYPSVAEPEFKTVLDVEFSSASSLNTPSEPTFSSWSIRDSSPNFSFKKPIFEAKIDEQELQLCEVFPEIPKLGPENTELNLRYASDD